MTTSDIINKLAEDHSLTTGRAEMILSIIVERITERLKSEGKVIINGFGEFKIIRKSLSSMIINDQMLSKNRITFTPSAEFLSVINAS
jgi:nucleoid DNA-binding protein